MKQRGFSLIELMVAVGILTLINIMIFASYPEFSQKIALKRTSEEIALIAREAQAYALGIKKSVSSGDNYFGFGIHFDKSNPQSLVLFTDSNSDKNYNAGELFQEFKIDTGDIISDMETCDSTSCAPISGNTLDIVYPRAVSIATISTGGIVDTSSSYARVTIKSPKGNKKYIKIWINGQISVE